MSNEIYIPSFITLNLKGSNPTEDGIEALKNQLRSYAVTMTKARDKVNSAIHVCVRYALSLTNPENRKDALRNIRECLKDTGFQGSFDACMGLIKDGFISNEEQFEALDFTSQKRENKKNKVYLGYGQLFTMLENRMKKLEKTVTVGDATEWKQQEMDAIALLITKLEEIEASAKKA